VRRVELADEVREARWSAAELAAMVDEENTRAELGHRPMLARSVALNVLHISESDAAGGAGRTAQKLHAGLNAAGHRSRLLVGRKVTDDGSVRRLKRNAAWRGADRLCGGVLDRLDLQYVFYPSSFAVARDPWFREADLVQLHNLHGSYFSFTALPALTKRRPAVWLLQDQWALTGHVAYSLDCERWREGCGSCPYLAEYPRLRRDRTALLWRLKRKVYERCRLTLIVPSRWMLELVHASPLLSRFPVHRIPHGVDPNVFRPLPKSEARNKFGLPEGRPVVLFSASDLNEPRKGLHLLEDALAGMDDPPLLALAGAGEIPRRVETAWLGSIEDDEVLAHAYSAADVLAVPTVADALTQTAIESIACGTPCVSFDRGGVTDVVTDETGYQARFGDIDDLARGLRVVLEDHDRYAARCREIAGQEFTVDLQVRRYVELYENVLSEPQPEATD
jgi:glycosyltransferase involved in cell wall biosynthesis